MVQNLTSQTVTIEDNQELGLVKLLPPMDDTDHKKTIEIVHAKNNSNDIGKVSKIGSKYVLQCGSVNTFDKHTAKAIFQICIKTKVKQLLLSIFNERLLNILAMSAKSLGIALSKTILNNGKCVCILELMDMDQDLPIPNKEVSQEKEMKKGLM